MWLLENIYYDSFNINHFDRWNKEKKNSQKTRPQLFNGWITLSTSNESVFTYKCSDNIQRYPLDGDFPVDSVIHPLNQPQVIKRNFLHTQQHLIKGHNIHMHIKLSLPCEKCIWNTVNGMLGDLLQSITLNP